MKHRFFQILALLAITTAASAQIRTDATLTVDSVQRQVILVRPTTAPPAGGYPLVFMFHGTSQDGEKFYTDSKWKELAQVENFVVVFPSSLAYCIDEDGHQFTTTKWNNGDLQKLACPGQNLKNDVHFVEAMLDTITRALPINRRMIYATGFSNGGAFTSKIGIEMSDVFAAVTAVGGALDDLDSARPEYYIPTWFMLGTKDDKWLKAVEHLGITELPFNDSTLYLLKGVLGRYLGALGLDTAHTLTVTPKTRTERFSTPLGSEPASEFAFTLVDNMFHVYPDGVNDPFEVAPIFWQFFRQHTSPASVPLLPAARQTVTIYPNPTSSYLVVQGEGRMTLTLRTMLGRQVFTTDGVRGSRIDLPSLPQGMYVADVVDTRGRSVTMVVVR